MDHSRADSCPHGQRGWGSRLGYLEGPISFPRTMSSLTTELPGGSDIILMGKGERHDALGTCLGFDSM